ncbi:MAG TPA: V-type ATP synthase subunit F [Firmicutes bacterium]|nr:V-type ATP synthase subunit F [Bacillota bacterium]
MYNRVGVIGDGDSILAFKAVGMEVFAADSGEQAREWLKELSKQDFAVLFITEQYAAANEDLLQKAKTKPFPAIVAIPTSRGSTGYGLESVRKDVEKAIGADILFNRED